MNKSRGKSCRSHSARPRRPIADEARSCPGSAPCTAVKMLRRRSAAKRACASCSLRKSSTRKALMTASHCACASGALKLGTRTVFMMPLCHIRPQVVIIAFTTRLPQSLAIWSHKARTASRPRRDGTTGTAGTTGTRRQGGAGNAPYPCHAHIAPRPRPTSPVAPPAPSRPRPNAHGPAPEPFVVPVRPARPSGPSGPSPTQKRSPRRMPGASLWARLALTPRAGEAPPPPRPAPTTPAPSAPGSAAIHCQSDRPTLQ